MTLVRDAEREIHVLKSSEVRKDGLSHRRFYRVLCGKEIKVTQLKTLWIVDYSRCPDCTRLWKQRVGHVPK